MKKTYGQFLVIFLLLGAGLSLALPSCAKVPASDVSYYTCGMHPSVHSSSKLAGAVEVRIQPDEWEIPAGRPVRLRSKKAGLRPITRL